LAAKKEAAPAKKSLFRTISEMDLFAPVKTQNDYGARSKKNVSCPRSSWIQTFPGTIIF
jgi:hypothetical protein